MVGGAKLFMDKISIMLRRYRNNWAFILHTAKTLRMSINYFWFRFFVNYKITLQGKIGGFLRAQKKYLKKVIYLLKIKNLQLHTIEVSLLLDSVLIIWAFGYSTEYQIL
jgi:hypothetical protein